MASTTTILPEEDFEYEPLPGPDHIRVLIIHPSRGFHDKLECSIEAKPIEASHYNALSYSWGMNKDGDATLNRALSISGRTQHITQNLFEGLLRLRQNSNPASLRLWVDAVCINQLDDDERTDQVSRMNVIYKCAMRTMIWLGESRNSEDDSLVLAVVKCANAESHRRGQHVWRDEAGETYEVCALFPSPTELEALEVCSEYEKQKTECLWKRAFTGAAEVFLRRYFTRRWIFQEIFHAGKGRLQVYWGSCECAISEFMQACSRVLLRWLHDTGNRERWMSLDGGATLVRTIGEVRRMLDAALPPFYETPTLEKALYWTGRMECSDDRDLVYSLTGIEASLGLVPDYRLSCAETYTLLAKRFVEAGRIQLIVNNCSGPTPEDFSRLLMPTWVPDLRFLFDLEIKFSLPSIPELKPEISLSNVLSLSPNVHGSVQKVELTEVLHKRFAIEVAEYKPNQSHLAALDGSYSSDTPESLWHLIRENVIVASDGPSAIILADTYARPNHLLVEVGDFLCSLADDKILSYPDLFIIRSVDLQKAIFKLVCPVTIDEDPRSRTERLPLVRARVHLI